MQDTETTTSPSENAPAATPAQFDQESAKRLMQRCIDDARNNPARLERDRQDWENMLMYRGGEYQWQVWDRTTNRFIERGTDPAKGGIPAYVPRPVTNVFAKKIDGVAALFDQVEPPLDFGPATGEDEDLATAEVAEDAYPVLLEEIGYLDELRPQINKFVPLIDKVALVLYYDNDEKYGTDTIRALQCVACQEFALPDEVGPEGTCPACEVGELQDAIDPRTNLPIGVEAPIGRLCGELVPSFELSLPRNARTTDTRRLPWVLTHVRMDPEEVLRWWGDKAQAVIERGKTGGAFRGGDVSRHFADALSNLSSPKRAQSNSGGDTPRGPVVYRLHHDPIVDDDFNFPDGVYAVMIDDEIVEAGPLPFTDQDGRPFKNVLIRRYDRVPGTAFGKPTADDLVPLQKSRNVVEALKMLALMHHAAPTVYIPLSVTLENEPTGTPGEHVYYRSVVPGEKPTTMQGLSPVEGLYKDLELIDQKMDEVSGLNAVLAGARPEGDPTLGEVEILQERGMGAFRGPINELTAFERNLAVMLLDISRQTLWVERYRRVRGENGLWEVNAFTNADLQGRIDITVTRTAAWPKSQVMRMLRLKEAFEMGLFPPAATDPEFAAKLLAELDLAALKPSYDVDRKQIAREIDGWRAATTPADIRPPDPVVQNIPLHLLFKRNFLKTEEAEMLQAENAPLYEAIRAHVEQLEQIEAQKAMAAAAMQAGQAGPGQGGDPLEAALAEGALQPAGAAGTSLEAAMAQGALMPAGAEAPAPAGPSIDDLLEAAVISPVDNRAGVMPAAGME